MKAEAQASCYHCALPIVGPPRYAAVVRGAQRSFCCPGCQAVAETIVSAGLDSFYVHRTVASHTPMPLSEAVADEWALYDRPDVQAPRVQRQGDQVQAVLQVEGIQCAACGWLIEKRLSALAGVREAQLNLSTHQLQVSWQDGHASLGGLLAELHRLGYGASVWQADEASAQRTRDNRQALRRLGVAGLLWFQAMMATMPTWPQFNLDLSPELHLLLRWAAMFLTTPIVFYSCAPLLRGALRDVRSGHPGMDLSVSLAIGGAYLAGIWTAISGHGDLYFDAVGMFALFVLSGRYLEGRARERTATATARLVKLLPVSCLRLTADEQTERVLLSDLCLGDRLWVLPGAVIAADGCIIAGDSSVDESLLTGEPRALRRTVGDSVTAGTLNVDSPLQVQILALGEQTRLSAILRLLQRAQAYKPRIAVLADRAARWFLGASLLAAVLVGGLWWHLEPARAFWVVLAMLVATCPCALALATPAALTAATGSLHRLGLLLTRGHVLEGLEQVDTVVFDKTGTLTEGRVSVREVLPLAGLDAPQCLALAAALQGHCEHPIARAFARPAQAAERMHNSPGAGRQGWVEGRCLRIGHRDYVMQLSAAPAPALPSEHGQWVLLGDADGALAWFGLDDPLRSDAAALLAACRRRGWRTLLLSGDRSASVAQVAEHLNIDEARGGLLPEDKLHIVQTLQRQGRRVLMIGDGINDVPVLAAADVSIAMAGASDLARTSADALLLSNRLSSLVDAFDLARRTRRIIRQNLAWACLYNGLMLPFAALGWLDPLWAAAGMSISSLTVVLNALRLGRLKERRPCPPCTS